MAHIEVLHVRDSDAGCEVQVFVDGVRVEVTMEDVDPGRGHLRSEWNERLREAQALPGSAFRDAYVTALVETADDPGIERD